jgi:hypothetical protein
VRASQVGGYKMKKAFNSVHPADNKPDERAFEQIFVSGDPVETPLVCPSPSSGLFLSLLVLQRNGTLIAAESAEETETAAAGCSCYRCRLSRAEARSPGAVCDAIFIFGMTTSCRTSRKRAPRPQRPVLVFITSAVSTDLKAVVSLCVQVRLAALQNGQQPIFVAQQQPEYNRIGDGLPFSSLPDTFLSLCTHGFHP